MRIEILYGAIIALIITVIYLLWYVQKIKKDTSSSNVGPESSTVKSTGHPGYPLPKWPNGEVKKAVTRGSSNTSELSTAYPDARWLARYGSEVYWIWDGPLTKYANEPYTMGVTFRKIVKSPKRTDASFVCCVDNVAVIFVNGEYIKTIYYMDTGVSKENLYTLKIFLDSGDNEILVDAYSSDRFGGFIGAIVGSEQYNPTVYAKTDDTWEVTPTSNSPILKDLMTILDRKRIFTSKYIR